jgi:coenzyme Q-binding protein COQ10
MKPPAAKREHPLFLAHAMLFAGPLPPIFRRALGASRLSSPGRCAAAAAVARARLSSLRAPLTFRESRALPFSPAHVYRVISSVEHYHLFVPWCVGSTVVRRTGPHALEAELAVGFRAFSERYVSRVALTPGRAVTADAAGSALFSHLRNEWRLAPWPQGATEATATHTRVDFSVEFEFRSPLYAAVAGAFMDEVTRRMMAEFERRCRETAGEEAARVAEEARQRRAAVEAEAAAAAEADAAARHGRERARGSEGRAPFAPPAALRSGLW